MNVPSLWCPDRRDHHAVARREIARLGGNLAGDQPEWPRHVFAERHQVHLVVAAQRLPAGRDQHRRIQRRAIRRVRHHARPADTCPPRAPACRGNSGNAGPRRNRAAPAPPATPRSTAGLPFPPAPPQRQRHLPPLHPVQRRRRPLLGFRDVGLHQQGRVVPAPGVRHGRQQHQQRQRQQPHQLRAAAAAGPPAPAPRPSSRTRTKARRRR